MPCALERTFTFRGENHNFNLQWFCKTKRSGRKRRFIWRRQSRFRLPINSEKLKTCRRLKFGIEDAISAAATPILIQLLIVTRKNPQPSFYLKQTPPNLEFKSEGNGGDAVPEWLIDAA
jgi:hypothetical protein